MTNVHCGFACDAPVVKKKSYVCKDKSEFFKSFMLKVTYSLWFSHFFSYETFENDKWHQQNLDLTVYNGRIGEYFYNLERSTTFNKEVLVVNESNHKKITSSKLMLKNSSKQLVPNKI